MQGAPQQQQRVGRRLAALFAADVAGYSRLMGRDEPATLAALSAARALMDGLIAEHGGRIANTAGDSVLAEFASAVDAVACAVAVQERLGAADAGTPEERRLRFRIAIHVGDVTPSGADLLGDGVNVAARLQELAEPGGVCVSGAAHDHVRKALPLAFDDLGDRTLKNIDEPVRAYRVRAADEAARAPVASPAAPTSLPLPDKPSIAVLPFTNLSGDPEQGYVIDGLVEEIIGALSRVRSFFVIARNSTFTYKGRAVDPREVGRNLGVRYVIEGSLRRSGHRLRIMAQLIDATTGSQVWGERYEGEVADIFELQDRVTEALVGAIEPTIALSEIARAKRKRPESLDAYDCAMRALPAIWSSEPETITEGLQLAEQAMTLDPAYALPKALAAWCYGQRVAYMRTTMPSADRAKTTGLAEEAARLAGNDALVLTLVGAAYAVVREFSRAAPFLERALAIDPNSAWAWHRSGWLHLYLRQSNKAIEHFRRAMRLSPLDPMNFNVLHGIAAAHFDKSEYDAAIRYAEEALREKPDALWIYRMLPAAYFHAGRMEEAQRTFAILRRTFPDITISKILDLTPASRNYIERVTDALRRMGLPE